MPSRVDHVVVLIRDLAAAAAAAEEMGFTVTGRGEHPHFGTANHLIVLQDSYIELLGIAEVRDANAAIRKRSEERPGIYGLAMATTDASQEHARLEAAGFPVQPPLDFTRNVALADSLTEARFRVVASGLDLDDILFFYCEHRTPELVWRPEWRTHPNGAIGLDDVGVVAQDPNRLAGRYSGFFNAPVVQPDADNARLVLHEQSISLMTLAALGRHLGVGGGNFSERQTGFAALHVRDLRDVRRHLGKSRSWTTSDGPGRLVVGHADLPGLAVEFRDDAWYARSRA